MVSIAADVGHTVCRPERRVERRPGRVEHAGDHARAAEPRLRDLGDHDVGVVAVGGDDDRVGVARCRASISTSMSRPWPCDELARPRRRAAAGAASASSSTTRHLVAVGGHLRGDRRAHPAAADDQQLHSAERTASRRPGVRRHRRAACRIVPARCPRPQRPPSACSASAPSARPSHRLLRESADDDRAGHRRPGRGRRARSCATRAPRTRARRPGCSPPTSRALRDDPPITRRRRGDGRHRADPPLRARAAAPPASRSSRPTSSCSPATARSCSPRPSATASSCASRPACAPPSR